MATSPPITTRGRARPPATLLAIAARAPGFAEWLREVSDQPDRRTPRLKLRTVWISDAHLGTAGCNAGLLLDFLKSIECETLYLVGDMIDGWKLRKGFYWPAAHNDVVRAVLKMAKYGSRVVYIPGNHDEMMRDYVGLRLGEVELLAEDVHTTADGRRLLVLHGDEFDNVVRYAKWLAFLGDHAYTLLLKSNRAINWTRRRFGLPYWSIAAHMKKRVKNAVQYISRFEEAVAQAAVDRRVDGVVCGHIHTAEIRRFGDVVYYNDGDWVESCTALVEQADGRIAILDWAEHHRRLAIAGQDPAPVREEVPACV